MATKKKTTPKRLAKGPKSTKNLKGGLKKYWENKKKNQK